MRASTASAFASKACKGQLTGFFLPAGLTVGPENRIRATRLAEFLKALGLAALGARVMPRGRSTSKVQPERRVTLSIGLTLILLASLALAPTCLAKSTNVYEATIEGAGLNQPGPVIDTFGIAIDQTSKDIYVADQNTNTVEKVNSITGQLVSSFANNGVLGGNENASGGFSPPWGIAVDQTTHDFYVANTYYGVVEKFDENGHLVTTFGNGGKLDGSATIAGGFTPGAVAVDPTNGYLYVADLGNPIVAVFNSSGEFQFQFSTDQAGTPVGVAVDGAGHVYVAGQTLSERFTQGGQPDSYGGTGTPVLTSNPAGAGEIAVNPANDNVYVLINATVEQYLPSGTLVDTFGDSVLSDPIGIAVGESDARVFVGNYGGLHNGVVAFSPTVPVPTVVSKPASSVSHTSATLTGEVNPEGVDFNAAEPSACYFEIVREEQYEPNTDNPYSAGHRLPCQPPTDFGAGSTPVNVSAEATELEALKTYHYRLVARDKNASGEYYEYGGDQTFTTIAVFGVETGQATEIEQSSAVLEGKFSSDGLDTHYYFEYGVDTQYGSFTAARPGADGGSQPGETDVSSKVANLTPGAVYHYRLVADNKYGANYGSDETFRTPGPPVIEGLRSTELTESSAVIKAQINPRGFETKYFVDFGTTSGYGSRAPVTDAQLPGVEGEEPVEIDLEELEKNTTYHFRLIATNQWGTTTTEDQSFNFFPPGCPNQIVRQQTGASYLPDCRAYELVSPSEAGNLVFFPGDTIGVPSADNAFAFSGALGGITGTDPPDNNPEAYVATRTASGWKTTFPGLKGDEALASAGLVANLDLSKTMDFETEGFATRQFPRTHQLPFLWDASTGESLGQWPPSAITNLVPNADNTHGAFQPSPDWNHLAFSSDNVDFDPTHHGLTTAPGSAYDFNAATEQVTVISKTPNGEDLPPGAAGNAEEFIEFPGTEHTGEGPPEALPRQSHPAVSTDGSHILMSIAGPGGVRLFMRVDDAVTYEVSGSHYVEYIGMTPNATEVFFMTSDALTPEDTDHSVDIYRWSAESDQLTLVSKGLNGSGNSDECHATWIELCDALPVYGWKGPQGEYPQHTDNEISDGGDIYFYSPEQLDGLSGVPNGQNLYDFRDGQVQFVATFTPHIPCSPLAEQSGQCANGPVGRIQVSPTDEHMAFITATRLTTYNNRAPNEICASRIRINGQIRVLSGPDCLEVYSYTPATGAIHCVSCDPDGAPPRGDANGSTDGLFMSNDGRIFFETPDPLVPQDTNNLNDIYEYVEGRPQLITTGTGALGASVTRGNVRQASLEGVTEDGANVFFTSYNTLVSQDQNGDYAKVYDARTNGGFPINPPPAPCAAADECHGAGSVAPPSLEDGTGANSGTGGNKHGSARRRERKQRRARTHRKHRHPRSRQSHRGRQGRR